MTAWITAAYESARCLVDTASEKVGDYFGREKKCQDLFWNLSSYTNTEQMVIMMSEMSRVAKLFDTYFAMMQQLMSPVTGEPSLETKIDTYWTLLGFLQQMREIKWTARKVEQENSSHAMITLFSAKLTPFKRSYNTLKQDTEKLLPSLHAEMVKWTRVPDDNFTNAGPWHRVPLPKRIKVRGQHEDLKTTRDYLAVKGVLFFLEDTESVKEQYLQLVNRIVEQINLSTEKIEHDIYTFPIYTFSREIEGIVINRIYPYMSDVPNTMLTKRMRIAKALATYKSGKNLTIEIFERLITHYDSYGNFIKKNEIEGAKQKFLDG